MTKWGDWCSLNSMWITLEVVRESALLVISCCLLHTCKYHTCQRRNRKYRRKEPSSPNLWDSLKMLLQNDKNGNMFTSAVSFQVGLKRQLLLSNLLQQPVCVKITAGTTQRIKNIHITYHRRQLPCAP
jgi:hypothetical protein